MVSSIAVLFGVPRSNGAMVALWAANLEPHEFIRGSSQPYVKAENAINLTWHEVRKKKFALVVAKNSVNYLPNDQLAELLRVADRFVANTFLVPPESKVTDREAAILVGPSIWHTLRLDDDSIACHDFFARTQADYEAMGLKVAPYGKNSALLTKGI